MQKDNLKNTQQGGTVTAPSNNGETQVPLLSSQVSPHEYTICEITYTQDVITQLAFIESKLTKEHWNSLPEKERRAMMYKVLANLKNLKEGKKPEAQTQPKVDLIKMTRHATEAGQPVEALVHPDEVNNYAMGGWVRAN
jgi:hypothetical protein